MSEVKVRFFGRFMYAMPRTSTQLIKVIAPRFDPVAHGEHFPLMTIRRDRLKFQRGTDGPILTTLAPTFKNISDATMAKQAELWVWNLSGLRVSFDEVGQVTLQPETGCELLDYPELEYHALNDQPVLSPAALKPAPWGTGKSTTVVDVTSGAGEAKRIEPTTLPYRFQKKKNLGGTEYIKKKGTTDKLEKSLADLVEFTIPLAVGKDTFTMTFKHPDESVAGTVTVCEGSHIGFSHVCSRIALPEERPDVEFLRYYNLLDPAAAEGERVVPIEQTTVAALVEGPDCAVKVAIPLFDE